MKKTIKLNESDIKHMVMEAVNELDWKTYDSAMRKAAKRGEWHRAGKFGDASVKAFNRDFSSDYGSEGYKYRRFYAPYRQGFDGQDDNGNLNYTDSTLSSNGFYIDNVFAQHPDFPDWNDYNEVSYRRTPDGKIHTSGIKLDKYSDTDDFNVKDNESDFWGNDFDSLDNKDIFTKADAMRDARKGGKETRDYLSGNYEYKPYKEGGKGWTLKDKNESIVREAVNRTLRKYLR